MLLWGGKVVNLKKMSGFSVNSNVLERWRRLWSVNLSSTEKRRKGRGGIRCGVNLVLMFEWWRHRFCPTNHIVLSGYALIPGIAVTVDTIPTALPPSRIKIMYFRRLFIDAYLFTSCIRVQISKIYKKY